MPTTDTYDETDLLDHSFMPSGFCRVCGLNQEAWEIASIIAQRIVPCDPAVTDPWASMLRGVDTLNVDMLGRVTFVEPLPTPDPFAVFDAPHYTAPTPRVAFPNLSWEEGRIGVGIDCPFGCDDLTTHGECQAHNGTPDPLPTPVGDDDDDFGLSSLLG
jgi:hypothetical protein